MGVVSSKRLQQRGGEALSSQRGWCPARGSSKGGCPVKRGGVQQEVAAGGGGGRALCSQRGRCPARGSSKEGGRALSSQRSGVQQKKPVSSQRGMVSSQRKSKTKSLNFFLHIVYTNSLTL